MTSTDEAIATVIQALSGFAVATQVEEELGNVVENKLRAAGLEFSREHHLSPRDRIDFLLDGVGLELKTKGAHGALLRQLNRYAGHDAVRALGVVTTQRKLCRLPESLLGKPIFAIHLGGV